jgi:hypothetical protein
MFGMKTARSVDEKIINVARNGGNDGIVAYGSSVRTIGAGNHLNLKALPPEFELLDGRGSESVACGQQYSLPARLNQVGQFGCCGRFAP